MIQHREMIDQLHHCMHRVLDDDDRDAVAIDLADDRNDVLERVVGEAGERPREFVSPGGSHTMLFVLKRVKK